MEKTRIIFTMGGGGFSMEPENPLLDLKALELTNKVSPKVCFLGTASGDSQSYIDRFYDAFGKHKCTPSHLALYKIQTKNIEKFILDQNLIYVGGGNTRNLIALWREWSLDFIIKNAYVLGTVLTGLSAGMICWFEQGLTDSSGVDLSALDCLGYLPGSACPHLDGESHRKEPFITGIKSGLFKPGFAADDGAGLLFEDERYSQCFSSRPLAKGYKIDRHGELIELKTIYLGGSSPVGDLHD